MRRASFYQISTTNRVVGRKRANITYGVFARFNWVHSLKSVQISGPGRVWAHISPEMSRRALVMWELTTNIFNFATLYPSQDISQVATVETRARRQDRHGRRHENAAVQKREGPRPRRRGPRRDRDGAPRGPGAARLGAERRDAGGPERRGVRKPLRRGRSRSRIAVVPGAEPQERRQRPFPVPVRQCGDQFLSPGVDGGVLPEPADRDAQRDVAGPEREVHRHDVPQGTACIMSNHRAYPHPTPIAPLLITRLRTSSSARTRRPAGASPIA